MESLRRQIDDEATMIGMIDEHLATDQRELDSINDAEAIRAEHVRFHLQIRDLIFNGNFFSG